MPLMFSYIFVFLFFFFNDTATTEIYTLSLHDALPISGGQKQRILLARALYRRPRLLFMDEGTSHLDIATERQVTAAVKALGLTRVIIAHRPETIASAPRRLE